MSLGGSKRSKLDNYIDILSTIKGKNGIAPTNIMQEYGLNYKRCNDIIRNLKNAKLIRGVGGRYGKLFYITDFGEEKLNYMRDGLDFFTAVDSGTYQINSPSMKPKYAKATPNNNEHKIVARFNQSDVKDVVASMFKTSERPLSLSDVMTNLEASCGANNMSKRMKKYIIKSVEGLEKKGDIVFNDGSYERVSQ